MSFGRLMVCCNVCVCMCVFTELLIQAFFKPGSSINPDHRDKYIFVLAYCVSVYEHPLSGEPCLDDLEATRKAIETSHLICSRANASHAELQVSYGQCQCVPN